MLNAVDFNSSSANFTQFRGPRLELSVLVISRDEETRASVAWVLKLFGCKHVLEATTAPGAAALIELLPSGEAVGLIFCDLALAKNVLANVSKAGESGKPSIPMLMICEKRFNREEASALLDAGVLGYITKPLRIQAIRGAVVKHILQGAVSAVEPESDIKSCDDADYERMESIGKGSFAEVMLVRRRRDGICFAMKEISIRNLDIRREKQVLTELRLHTSFAFPFIVRTFSAWLKDHMAYLLMEYVESGPLSSLVSACHRDDKEISNESIISWCGQMVLGLIYLHQKEVLHRDLKLDNILGPDSLDRVKLADFGISRALAGEEQPMSIVGTPMAMAPERYASHASVLYGTQSDLWSLGVVLYELATLHPPFQVEGGRPENGCQARAGGAITHKVFDEISSRVPQPLPYRRSPVLHRIVTGGLLQKRPDDRPTCSELCQEPSISAAIHAFLAQHNLLSDAAVLEVVNVLPPREDATARIECPQEEISTLRARDISGWKDPISPTWRKPVLTMDTNCAELRDGADSHRCPLSPSPFTRGDLARGELQLAEAKWRLEELSKELVMAKNECVRLRRPSEVAKQQLLSVATFSEPGVLRCTLQFADPNKEAQYLHAHASRLTFRAAFGVLFLIAGCASLARLSREISGCSHRAFHRWEVSGVFLAAAVAPLSVMLPLAFYSLCARSDAATKSMQPRVMALRELLGAGLLSMAALLAIFNDASPEQASGVCFESQPLRLVLWMQPLIFGPRVLHIRWIVLVGVYAVAFVSYAIAQFDVDGTGAANKQGVLLLLIALLCYGLLLERRTAERGERLRFLVGSSSDCMAEFPASPLCHANERSNQKAGRSDSKGSGGMQSFKQNLTRSTSSVREFAQGLARSSSSILGFSHRLLRTTSSESRYSEDVFMDVEDAIDRATRSESLWSIRRQGEKEQWLLDNTNVRILQEKLLGCGGFGMVLQGELFGAPVAVKMPKSSDGEFNISDLSNELRVLRHVWHPNIVKFFGSCIDPGSGGIVVVLELLKGVQLDSFVCAAETPPDTATRRRVLLDICRALCYLHEQKPRIVHGDLKGSNILVEMWLAGPRTKLLDFGLSRLLTRRVNPLGGTVNWMAPEIIRGGSGAPDASADVFSFGRLAFMVVAGRRPLCDMSFDDIVHDATNLVITPLSWPSEETPLVTECHQLVRRCLRLSALMRPSMEEVHAEVLSWSFPQWHSETTNVHLENATHLSTPSMMRPEEGSFTDVAESMKSLSIRSNLHMSAVPRCFECMTDWSTSTDNTRHCVEEIMLAAEACNRLIDLRRLELMTDKVFGNNRFGFVLAGRLDGSLVVVRTTSGRLGSKNFAESQDLRFDLKSLLVVKHPCIVALHGLCIGEGSNILAVLEWVEGVPLENFVCSANVGMGRVLASTRHRLLLDVASALWYLHDQRPPIAHGGLTGSHIIVESRLAGPRAKLLDFGLSRLLARMVVSHRTSHVQASPSEKRWQVAASLSQAIRDRVTRRRKELVWTAPEALRERYAAFTTSADVFVYGRLTYLVVTGREPFHGIDARILERAARKSAVVPPDWPDSGPQLNGSVPHPTFVSMCRPLYERCCIPNPMLRPGMDGVFHSVKLWMVDLEDRRDPHEDMRTEEERTVDSEYTPVSVPSVSTARFSSSTGVKFPSSNLGSVPEDESEEDELPDERNPMCCEGHALVRREDMGSPSITCNFCDRQLIPEVAWWSCGECDLNMCHECVSNAYPRDSHTVGPLLVRQDANPN